MSMLAMTPEEQKTIDSRVEQMLDWAKTRSAEAEQLALDSARLMACTTDRLDRLKNQGFFKRCWNRLSGKAGEMERANVNDIIQMQKTAFRYVNMLQEQQLLMAHSLLSLKNNLISLAVKEEETRNLIAMLAQRTLERFEKLEHRVDQLEISTNLQGWLLGLEEREYNGKIPTEYMRLFRVINDFYQLKNDNWNYNDLIFMRRAIRTVGLNPKQKISLNTFIDTLTDEIQNESVGFDAYGQAITMFVPKGIENYSKFVVDNISSPVFASIHGLKTQFMDRLDIVEELQDEMNISTSEALKRLLRRSISKMNINMDYEFPLAETAIEILGCLRLSEKLALESDDSSDIEREENSKQDEQPICLNNVYQQPINIADYSFGEWQTTEIKLGSSSEEIDSILLWNDKCFCASKGIIWQSSDMKNWMKCAEFEAEGYYTENLFNSGKYIFYRCDDKFFRSLDGSDWELINIFKDNIVIYKNEKIGKFNLKNKGKCQRIDTIVNSGHRFFALLISTTQDFQNNLHTILYSLDGIKWSKLEGFDFKINKIYSFDNKLLILSRNGEFLYNPENNLLELININSNLISYPNNLIIPTDNIAAVYEKDKKIIYISNNLKDWKTWEIPYASIVNLTMNRKMIATIQDKNKKLIHWAPLEKNAS